MKRKFSELPYNPRTITDEKIDKLKQSLLKLGDLSGIIYNRKTKQFPAGNQRSKAIDLSKCEIEVIKKNRKPDKQGTVIVGFVIWEGVRYNYREVDWTIEQEKEANIIANMNAGDWDMEALKEHFEKDDLIDWGFDPGELNWADDQKGDPEKDNYVIPEKIKTDIVVGDLLEFKLNGLTVHRLLCGDSANPSHVAKLMNGATAALMLTDPPYGVKMDKGFGGADGFGGKGKAIKRKQYGDDWDSVRPETTTFALLLKQAKKSIIFGGNFFADQLPISQHWIVWDKLNTMPTFGDCELAWTNIKRKSVKKYTVQYNGLIGKEKERFHPTQKPVKIFRLIIEDYTKAGELVVDFYLGSGTCLIAAHELGRVCFGMEQSPNYCQVTANRVLVVDDKIKLFKNGKDVTTKYRKLLK